MMSFGKLTLQMISRPDYGGLPHVQADLLPKVPEPIPPGTMCSWQVRNLHITPMLVSYCVCEKRYKLHKNLNWCCWQNLHKSSPRTWLHPETITWRNVGKVQNFYGIGHKLTHIPVSFEDNPYNILLWNWMGTILLPLINLMRFVSKWALSSLSSEFFPTTNPQVCCVSNRRASKGGAQEEGREDWKVIALLQRWKQRAKVRPDVSLKLEIQ